MAGTTSYDEVKEARCVMMQSRCTTEFARSTKSMLDLLFIRLSGFDRFGNFIIIKSFTDFKFIEMGGSLEPLES